MHLGQGKVDSEQTVFLNTSLHNLCAFDIYFTSTILVISLECE